MIEIISSYLSLHLHSDDPIKNTYKITNINNYKLLSCSDNEELEILSIDIDSKNYINDIFFTIRDSKNNKQYKLLLNNFRFEYKNGEKEEQKEFEYTSRSEMPGVLKVTSTSPINMIVHFTKEMKFNNDILNKNRYIFEDATLKTIKVEKHSNSSVKLLTSRQIPGKLYQLKVI